MTTTWPSGVTDQTPLPFALWRVLDALARKPDALVDDPRVQEALTLAEQYAARAQRQEQLVDDRLFVEVSAALMACVGPMGRVMVEDALDELPAPVRLSALLRTIAQELEDAQRQAFARQLRARDIV
ncbi:hypothetical protein GCM10022631_12400 [Deinococcus rubellus]|uniref:DUF8082 domain-containing protein n=1 Tax=Deinococcus rubellus TaxID=1889240 RepID=A0ABY5YCD5_9DEIO|nr:hypothetical protein [Deinococcus rubellus]UWX62715.1 hypothetical protein N0D28_08005 [Deinococcus rubellus]